MKNNIKKFLICTILIVFFSSFTSIRSNADGYTYDFWKNVIPSTDGLTYSQTYYHGDIDNLDPSDTENIQFDTPVDLTTYEDKIYVLDSRKYKKTQISSSIDVTGVSCIYVLNQDFKKIEKINEFLLTDEVKKTLDDYYGFNTPLSSLKEEHYTTRELVNTYKNKKTYTYTLEDFEVVDGKLVLKEKIESNLLDSTAQVIVTLGSAILPKDAWEATSNDGYVFALKDVNSFKSNDQKLTIKYGEFDKFGKAPYFAYSKDPSKAAIRLNNAMGITVTGDGLYVADTSNSRIIKANKNASGEWVVNCVYLTPSDNVFYQVSSGTSLQETNNTLFEPNKIAVDNTGKVFCIAANTYEGIVEFDSAGSFNRFIGKNEVVANPLKKFWAKIFSEAQIDALKLDLPPEFTNISIDHDGFLYATSKPDADATKIEKMVKMINTSGKDVLKRNGYVTPDGDAVYITASPENGVVLGPSRFVGITVSENGNFTVVDNNRGRLFTYDNEGNLLFITGDQPGGTEADTSTTNIVNPLSIKYFKRNTVLSNGEHTSEEILILLDGASNSLLVFETTEFGKKVNLAISRYQEGIFEDVYDEAGNVVTYGAEHYWQEVLKMNTNYELAHLGIGKAQYRRGEYKLAMASFKLAHNANYYSKAYAEYRDSILSKNFAVIMSAVVLVVVAYLVFAYKKLLAKKNQRALAGIKLQEAKQNKLLGINTTEEVVEEVVSEEHNELFITKAFGKIRYVLREVFIYPIYILTHPIEGFTEFKNDKKAKMWVSITILLLFVLMKVIAYQYEGIIINKNNPAKFDSLQILIYGVLPPAILAVANWSVTTLLDGKGKMKEIFMMICYSMLPVTLVGFLNIILSNVFTLDEAQFITLLKVIGWLLTGVMAFMGLVVIHEYGVIKTIGSIILTVIATLIIAFIALLMFDLAQQIYGFVYSLYKEISTRYF